MFPPARGAAPQRRAGVPYAGAVVVGLGLANQAVRAGAAVCVCARARARVCVFLNVCVRVCADCVYVSSWASAWRIRQ